MRCGGFTGFDGHTQCIARSCWQRLSKQIGSCVPPLVLCLLALSAQTDARPALPGVEAPDAGPRSAIFITPVPVAQAPNAAGYVNLPTTKAVIHVDDVVNKLRPADGPVQAQADKFREDLKIMLQKANAVAALRRAGLLKGSMGIPSYLQNRSIEYFNTHAVPFDTPAGAIKPVLSQEVKGPPGQVKSFTDNTFASQTYSAGSVIELLLGVRLATPFFGTGFNFCIGMPDSG